jgi:hypothetical protein
VLGSEQMDVLLCFPKFEVLPLRFKRRSKTLSRHHAMATSSKVPAIRGAVAVMKEVIAFFLNIIRNGELFS